CQTSARESSVLLRLLEESDDVLQLLDDGTTLGKIVGRRGRGRCDNLRGCRRARRRRGPRGGSGGGRWRGRGLDRRGHGPGSRLGRRRRGGLLPPLVETPFLDLGLQTLLR